MPFAKKSITLFKKLMYYDNQKSKLKIKTKDGKIYRCKLQSPAEGEEDLAYHIETLDDPPKYFILECNFIDAIEEL